MECAEEARANGVDRCSKDHEGEVDSQRADSGTNYQFSSCDAEKVGEQADTGGRWGEVFGGLEVEGEVEGMYICPYHHEDGNDLSQNNTSAAEDPERNGSTKKY